MVGSSQPYLDSQAAAMAPKALRMVGNESKVGTGSNGAASSSSGSLVGSTSESACLATDDVTLLRLYKRCMEGKPRDKLKDLDAAHRALRQLKSLTESQPSSLGCLLLVRSSDGHYY